MMPTGRLNGWIGGTRNAPVLPILLPTPHIAGYTVGPQSGVAVQAQPSDPADLIIYGGHRTVTLTEYADDVNNIGTAVLFSIGEVYGALLLDRVSVVENDGSIIESPDGYRAQVIILGFEVPRRIGRRPGGRTVPAYTPSVYAAWFDFVNGELLLTTDPVDGLYWTYDPSFGLIIETSIRGGQSVLVDSSDIDFIHIILP
jgi:hypothetical protein